MTATCSSMAIVEHYDGLLMSETLTHDAVYTSLIQRIIEYEIILSLMAYPPKLVMRSKVGALQIMEIDKYISIPGSEDSIKNISPRISESSGTTSPDSTRSFEISYVKTNDFLEFVEIKSKSNSWRMTIYLLIFLPITHSFNMYWNGFTIAMMVVLRNKT
jgi:hypothetical protein